MHPKRYEATKGAREKILEKSYPTEKNSKVNIWRLAGVDLYLDGYTMAQSATLLRIHIRSVQAYQ